MRSQKRKSTLQNSHGDSTYSHNSSVNHSSRISAPWQKCRTIIGFGKGHLQVNKASGHYHLLKTPLIPYISKKYLFNPLNVEFLTTTVPSRSPSLRPNWIGVHKQTKEYQLEHSRIWQALLNNINCFVTWIDQTFRYISIPLESACSAPISSSMPPSWYKK